MSPILQAMEKRCKNNIVYSFCLYYLISAPRFQVAIQLPE